MAQLYPVIVSLLLWENDFDSLHKRQQIKG